MKYLVLAGTLGALLLLVLVPSVSNPAFANIFVIDNFTDDGGIGNMNCDQTLSNPALANITAFGFNGLLMQVIGESRECQLQLLIPNFPDSGESTVVQADEMYRHMSGPGVSTMSYLQYDGDADGIVGGGRVLDLNLFNSDDIQIDFSFVDFPVNVTVTTIDGAGESASLEGKLPGLTLSLANIKFPLANFVLENPLLNLGDIDEINFNFTNNVVATDYTLEKIHITMVMVGGEMFPTDTTALLLAGAELNAIWILPAIAAIGIGAFVVSRKRK